MDRVIPRTGRFSIGRVLRDSLGILLRNLVLFVGVAMVLHLITLLAPSPDHPQSRQEVDWVAVAIASALGWISFGLTEAGIVFGTFQSLRGRKATISDILRGLRFAIPVILAGVICSLLFEVSDVIELLLPDKDMDLLSLGIGVGALVLFVSWWPYPAVIVIEGKGALAGLRRSAQLTKGRRWPILGLLVVTVIAMLAPSFLVSSFGDGTLWGMLSGRSAIIASSVEFLVDSLETAFFAVTATVSYHDLRSEREGFGVEDIVTVFD